MVRPANVARSRACNQCKRKRIKCDLQSPSCQRCIESNLLCSGPVSGLMLVNTNAQSFTQANTSRPISRPTSRALIPPSRPAPPPVIYQAPDPQPVYDDALLWKFLDYFSQNAAHRTWSSKLPSLVAAKNAAAMTTAARAVSLAFAAQNTGNVSMAATACEHYGNSLRYHQASFVTRAGKRICWKKAKNALPVTVLLSYFEMIQATSPQAWLEHTFAAERLFLRLGRCALRDSLLNHLYFIVRSNSTIRCFLSGQKTLLLEQSWREVPMQSPCGKGTAIYHHLEDLVLWLSHHLNGEARALAGTDSMTYNVETLQTTLNDLVVVWANLAEVVGFDTDTEPLLALEGSYTNSGNAGSYSTTMATSSIPTLPPYFREPSVSLTVAVHHAATILVLVLLQQAITSSPISYGDYYSLYLTPPSSITHHSTQILSAALYLEQQFIGCSCLRMILPLTVVYRHSPDPEQRSLAETVFRRWSMKDGLAGLATVAFGSSPALLDNEGAGQWIGSIVQPEMTRLMQMNQYGAVGVEVEGYSPPEEFRGMVVGK